MSECKELKALQQALDAMTAAANEYRAHAAGLDRKIESLTAELLNARAWQAKHSEASEKQVHRVEVERDTLQHELQMERANKLNMAEAWDVAQTTIERQRAKIGDLCNETQEHRAKIAWLNELVATLRAGSSHEAAQEAQDKIEKQRTELDRLNKLVTQLRSANVKLAESAYIFPDDFEGNLIDVPAEARWAMEALHRIRMAIRERRQIYALPVDDRYNKGYHDGGNNALNAIEVAIGGAE